MPSKFLKNPSEEVVKDVLARLRRLLPTKRPVRLYFFDSNDDNDDGYCKKTKKGFVIGLRRTHGPYMLLIFLHEYAHARCWDMSEQSYVDYHDPHWGMEYGLAYKEAFHDR